MEPKNLTDIIADLSLVQNPQDPQKQQPSPAQQPKPDVIDQARGAEGPDWYRASDFIAPVGVNVQGTRIDQQIRPTAARRMQDVLDRMDQQDPTAPAPTPTQQRPFQDAAVALKKQLSDDLMRSFNATYAQNPDFAAEVNTIASRLNLSPDLVMRNPEEARKVYDMLTFQRRGLLAKNPAMATSLSDPKIMAVAKDDLDNLSWWDSGWNSYERSQLNMQKGYLGYALQSAQRFGNVAYEKELRAQIADEVDADVFPGEHEIEVVHVSFFTRATELCLLHEVLGRLISSDAERLLHGPLHQLEGSQPTEKPNQKPNQTVHLRYSFQAIASTAQTIDKKSVHHKVRSQCINMPLPRYRRTRHL